MEQAKAGIICLTKANLHSDWLLFEAGALSKKVAQSFVCPLLIDLKPSDVVWPLAQFQATTLEKGDVLKLLKTLKLAAKGDALSEAHLEKAFDRWWPDLETIFTNLPAGKVAPKPERSEKAILEEILELVREQSRPKTAIWHTTVGTSTEPSIHIQSPASSLAVEIRDCLEALCAKAVKDFNISPFRVVLLGEDEKSVTIRLVIGKNAMNYSVPKLGQPERLMSVDEDMVYSLLGSLKD